MKSIYTIALLSLILLTTKAQTPEGINYQGVARNASGNELSNQNIAVKISVLNGSAVGAAIYSETHTVTTNKNGLFTLVIGAGIPTSGTFGSIDWSNGGGKWLQVSMDISGGSSFVLMGTSQLMSVPYAQYAGKVANNGGKSILILTDSITDAQAATIIASEVGSNTHEIKIVDCVNLTTVDLSSVRFATSIEVLDNPALATVNLSGLKKSFGILHFNNCPQLNSINLPALTRISSGGISIENSGATSISAPQLALFSGNLSVINDSNLVSLSLPLLPQCQALSISGCKNLSAVDLSNLTMTNGLLLNYCAALTTFNLPNVIATGALSITNTALNSISFPQLTSCVNLTITDNAVTSISLPSLYNYSGQILIGNNQLTVSEVDAWLAKTVTYTIQAFGSITVFNSGGQTPPAPPSTASGQSNKSFLSSQGVIVLTD